MSNRDHWESVYQTKGDKDVSWTQADPALSLSLIREVCKSGSVIDVGGGTSVLADRLLDAGYAVAVLDISQTAIDRDRLRLGERAAQVQWIVSDVTAPLKLGIFDVWHDRAVFHFLTDPKDRDAYIDLLWRTIPLGGHAIIATFSPAGPDKCSGLPVCRYDGPLLS